MSNDSPLLRALKEANEGRDTLRIAETEDVIASDQSAITEILESQTKSSVIRVDDGVRLINSSSAMHHFSASSCKRKSLPTQPKQLRGNTTGVLIKSSSKSSISSSLLGSQTIGCSIKRLSAAGQCKRQSQYTGKPCLPITIFSDNKNNVTTDDSVDLPSSFCQRPAFSIPVVSDVELAPVQGWASPSSTDSLNSSPDSKRLSGGCDTVKPSLPKMDYVKERLSKYTKFPVQDGTEPQSSKCLKVDVSATKSFYGKKLADAGYRRASFMLKKPGGMKGRVKAKAGIESEDPVCLTLSSDEEEREIRYSDQSSWQESNSENDCEGREDNHTSRLQDADYSDQMEFSDTEYENVESFAMLDNVKRGLTENISVLCNSIRIGSYKVKPVAAAKFTYDHLSFAVPAVTNDADIVSLQIQTKEISYVAVHFGKNVPVMFLCLTPCCASRIRSRLKMIMREGPYFDPASKDEIVKWLVLLPSDILPHQMAFLKKVFLELSTLRVSNNSTFYQEIDYKTANDILVKLTPRDALAQIDKCLAKNKVEVERRSPRSPVIKSVPKTPTECITLATYPPPPEVGGLTVTSHDLRCLVPGEFLNDVIIDFYLRYLFCNKLSKEDQDRTHIFSSFFYKRLTNSDMPAEDTANNTSKSLPVSNAITRHSRVKKWTRNVNIFEKDFIIIPINESSHWFLVIICFSYLVGLVGDEESCPPPSAEHDYDSTEDLFASEDDNMETSSDIFSEQTALSKEVKKCISSTSGGGIPICKSFKDSDQETDLPRRPCILLFDSLRTRNCWGRIFTQLREYLAIEYQHKMNTTREFSKETIRGTYPNAPQQTNYSDCGLYLLQYVQSFFEKPIRDFTIPIQGVSSWFSNEELAKNKRNEIKEVILKLHKEQSKQALGPC